MKDVAARFVLNVVAVASAVIDVVVTSAKDATAIFDTASADVVKKKPLLRGFFMTLVFKCLREVVIAIITVPMLFFVICLFATECHAEKPINKHERK